MSSDSKLITCENEVDVKREDQMKINKFARSNAKLQEFQEERDQKKKELANLLDAENEVLLIEDPVVMFFVGELFFCLPQENIQSEIDAEKERCNDNVNNIEKKIEKVKELMAQLKIDLYAKFGGNINLEHS